MCINAQKINMECMMSKRKIVISVWTIALFVIVWVPFYNTLINAKDPLVSTVVAALIFALIYFWMSPRSREEDIFTQIFAIIVPDVIMFTEAGLIGHQMPLIVPMIEAMVGQICGTILVILIASQYFEKKQKPQTTFLVHGRGVSDEAARAFAKRLLEKYKHKFKFSFIASEDVEAKLLIEQIKANDVIILYNLSPETRGDFQKICCEMKKKYYFTSSIEDMISQGTAYRQFDDTMLLEYQYKNDTDKVYTAKRLLDMFFSAVFMIVLSPIILIAAAAIKLEDQGTVIQKQKCCTKDARFFTRYTFRTMSEDEGQKNTPTKVGRILRRTGVYGLPQLLNVFKGEMSFVGPQPESPEITKYNTQRMAEYSYRLWCSAGMTGYSQLYSRRGTPVLEKISMDIMYVENHTISMDFKIIVLSLLKILINQSI